MRVLISGGGIAGPSLAWFLAKTGAHVTVLERAAALLPHGQNVDLQGSGISVIKKMGLMDEVRRANTTEKGTRFIDPKGRPFAPLPVQEGEKASVSFSSQFEILRGDLAAILYKASKDLPNVEYLLGTTVKEVISNNEAVKVSLSNGETQEYDLLVAADGQWSRLRKKCFPPDSITVVHKGMYAAYFTIPRLPIDDEWWSIYHGLQSRTITLRPDPHGTTRAMFTIMPLNEAQEKAWMEAGKSDRQTQEALVRSEFANAGWQAKRLLDAMPQAPDFYFHVIQQIKMTKWSNGRIICLGDTAFAPSPLTGMGTTLAVVGGYVLAGELSALKSGEHPTKAFQAYENKFRPFVEEYQKVPWLFPGFIHPASGWKRWLLQNFISVFAKVGTIPWVASNIFGDNVNDDQGFPLPQYPAFEKDGSE
ncbi:hypothetical protein LTR08_006490 [Meristemomyces frigidus]|nr:hypothetical protein LTR08_006490 [Meristemomyces frigidus]